ncbi:3-hydroxyacyl-ACP dehydratase FabZ family protein [Flavobacterium silvaticum]|uniref:Hydroxymyristoyl-ACP dehydratase n=1 Tax=Flavobacterium silvaticum TaxID=1852020 RepID=A0A972FMW9_9FLAO|nr:FabA/FabZ family ACP-dehydratase [Flavobacterium silvaticum]NMH28981.1 hydroxymyristoyl-ACP dehydratase [Flavobacterium silvaticum]
MESAKIISRLPYSEPFLFVDEIISVDENSILGSFRFDENLDFYRGHFRNNPITPGVILIECMAQIGLAAFGIYLIKDETDRNVQFVFTSSEAEFLKPVFPGETVFVTSRKIYFRFGKLKCEVIMETEPGEKICKATLSGMITNQIVP